MAGKEVVQMYVSAPQGVLGKAAKVLCAFDKTSLLEPGDSETLTLTAELNDLASYDDTGKTAYKSAYVLEAGDYKFFVGNSVKEAGTRLAGTHNIESLTLVEQLSAQSPTLLEKRLLADGSFETLTEVKEETGESGVIKVEAESFIEVGSTANTTSSNPKTEAINGTLYDPETDTWNAYTGGTALSNTSFAGAYTIYKVTAEKAGFYNLTMRGANHATKTQFTVTASVSQDGATYTGAITSPSQTLKNPDTNKKWNNHFDFDFNNCLELKEGENYIKLTFADSPNLDFFTLTEVTASIKSQTQLKVEGESLLPGTKHTTENFTSGYLYNGTAWEAYSGTSLGSTYTGPATYRIFVGEEGNYKFSFRMSRHLSFDSFSISVATSTDNSTFTTVTNTGTHTSEEWKAGYNSYIDAPCATWVNLKKGYNYIKLTFSGAPNVDFFTITALDYVPEGTIKVEGESFDATLSSANLGVEASNSTSRLYNDADGKWYSYKTTVMNNSWRGPAVFVVDIETAGSYSVGVRAARHANASSTYTVTAKASTTTTFGTGITSDTIDKTNPDSTTSYFSLSDFKLNGTLDLKKGTNYIQLSYKGNPNIDFFTLTLESAEEFTLVEPEDKDSYYQLKDVVAGTVTVDEFVGQMKSYELASFFVSYPGLNFGGSDEVNAKYGFSRAAISDGPSGIGSRATSFPCETIIACTWNTDLVEAFGRVMGKEIYDNSIDVWAAPGVNLHRNPLSGRNSEYYSEDPFLSGVMATTTVKAVQRYGVSVCIKHFVCNEKESNKLAQDVRVSERALREIYLLPFEMAVKDGKAQGIMSSYNIVNGVAMSENYDILTNILRNEWGYDYYISGDWNNNKNMINEINAGHGVREPYTYCDINTVIEAVNAGLISRETLEKGVKHELNTLMRVKNNYTKWGSICNGEHTYIDDVCSVCHAPDPNVFKKLDETVENLVDNLTKAMGFKATVLESTMTAEKNTIRQNYWTNKLNTLNADKTRAELTIYNTMASKAEMIVKMGIFVNDSAWTRVTGSDGGYSFTGDKDVYRTGDWVHIPYGSQATLYYDLSDSSYDTFIGKNDAVFTRNDYLSIVYFGAASCQAGDSFYIKGDGLSSSTTTQLGMSIEGVTSDIAFNGIGSYNIVSRLEGDYGTMLDSALLEEAGLSATDGNFFNGKVNATYILKATDNADYIFKGWYDADENLISTEKLVAYDTLDVPTGTNNVYAHYVIKDAKAYTNTLQGATLDIGSSLTVNYFADLDEAHKDAVLLITHKNASTELKGEKDASTGMYVFKYENINPQCMTDDIKAELVFDGQVISEKDNYSVKTYAMNLMTKTAVQLGISDAKYDALVTLLSDMLVYGDNAQDYMNYNKQSYATEGVDWLAPSSFTVPADGVKRVVSGNNDASNRISGCGLHMANVNKIYFSVNNADTEIYLDGIKVAADESGRVYTDAIKATEFDKVYSLQLKSGDEIVAEVEYNVNAYITSKNSSSTIGGIVKALSNYGVSAKAYASVN